MRLWLFTACACAMTLVQDIVPGAAVYHAGWYNALIAAAIVLALVPFRRGFARAPLAALGAVLLAVAGIVSGLTGPPLDGATETIVGAPGTVVQNPDFGTFVFPSDGAVRVGRAYRMNSIVWQQPRTVVRVAVFDPAGNHLTITQPTNASFLSPVLLMQQRADIGGTSLPVDTFAVPALSKTVRALLLEQRNSVVFDVTPARRGIGSVMSGGSSQIGGLVFHAWIEQYPAFVAASAPNAVLLSIGCLLVFAGAFRSWSRSRT